METTTNKNHFKSVSYKIPTPDGTLFVFVVENMKGEPFEIDLVIGKAGAPVNAWANSTARLCSELLQGGNNKINDLIIMLSNTHGDKVSRTSDNVIVRSGVDGLCLALRRYQQDKYKTFMDSLGIEEGDIRPDEDDDED